MSSGFFSLLSQKLSNSEKLKTFRFSVKVDESKNRRRLAAAASPSFAIFNFNKSNKIQTLEFDLNLI